MSVLRRRVVLGARVEPPRESVSELFHENTKLRKIPFGGGTVPGEYEIPEVQAMSRGYKHYRNRPQIALPRPSELPENGRTFDDVIAARRSIRSFADEEMELGELGRILYQTYGITGEAPKPGGGVWPFRAAPSAGALYPGELYLGVRRVEGLAPGIYHYEVPGHSLALLEAGDPGERLYEVCCFQAYACQAAVVFLIAAAVQRTKRKYGERGYRYALLDLGHLAQNLYLASTALGLAVTTTCGFFDDEANRLLRLDGLEEAVLYVGFVGRAAARRETDSYAWIEPEQGS